MNIIASGAPNPDPTLQVYEFIGGPLHGSKLPVHPRAIAAGIEVGLEVGGKTVCYEPKTLISSGGHKRLVYVYVKD